MATELQAEGCLCCHLLVLLPAGSMRGQRQVGSVGLADAGPRLSPAPANTQQREPHNWRREKGCGSHGGGWEGLIAPKAAPRGRQRTGANRDLRGKRGGRVGNELGLGGLGTHSVW